MEPTSRAFLVPSDQLPDPQRRGPGEEPGLAAGLFPPSLVALPRHWFPEAM